ncbi:rest corepressor (corest)-like protein [Euroglyphus maynei]|uniref:Rest corepressor (Corest)-like protein n=1 Tax=Euroglyphus maynei TaxID=6958 RepID=A0A1Y3BHY3_EURMA|nr:rest corepressor (corest)-like protein [Euroglyphus maynei]
MLPGDHAHNDNESPSYQQQQLAHHHHQHQPMSHHHSLPTTPIEHATTTTTTTQQQQQQQQPVASMHDTNHQQFNFIFPDETPVNEGHPNTANDLMDSSRDFHIDNCLAETNYQDYSLFNSTAKEGMEQVFSLDHNEQSTMQFDGSQINAEQPDNKKEENAKNEHYFPPSTSHNTFVPQYDNDGGCNSKSNIVQFITEMMIDDPSTKTDYDQKDMNDNYVMAAEKQMDHHPYPRIKSPNNFIKSLNKKLSAISNEYDHHKATIPAPPPPPPHKMPIPTMKKKRPRPEPLYIPPHVNTTFVYHSQLRSPRLWNSCAAGSMIKPSYHQISPPPYTPPPMLSPVRSGSGLFWKINNHGSNKLATYSNTSQFFNSKKMMIDTMKENQNMINEPMADLKTPTTAYEPEYDIPATDIEPHVNIGSQFQARIPTFNANRMKIGDKSDRAILLWSPTILDDRIDEESIDLYFKISCSMCVNGHGNNKEYALHLLHDCHGDVMKALARLIQINPSLDSNHPLYDYYYASKSYYYHPSIINNQ